MSILNTNPQNHYKPIRYMSTPQIVNYIVASVWLINGLLCKVLNLVPRHQQIVAMILGSENSMILTKLIGVSEIAMAVWIITGRYARLNVVVQVLIIATMNILEFILVPDLLLWGRFNIVFAFMLILLILCNEFYLKNK